MKIFSFPAIFFPSSIPRVAAMLALGTAMAVLLAGCHRKSGGSMPGGPGGPGGPQDALEVGVLTVAPTQVTLTQDLPGRTSAFRSAEVRARVTGIIQKRFFTEGSDVKEGEVLYQIDPASYQASFDNARGTLARAEANLEAARLKAQRYKELVAAKAVSKQDYDDAVATQHADEADVISGQASLETARINLGYTKVVSPISGRIGASQVTEGAYVQESGATLLATVQQFDPVYVDVTQSTRDVLRLRNAVATGEITTNEAGQARTKLLLEDGTEYSEEGTLQFADVTVNTSTSSVTVRAIFPNSKLQLLPGMFVRARLVEGQKQDAIVVPQLAVMRDAKGQPIAYVAGENGVVEQRALVTPRAIGNQWLVSSGLKAGDHLIVNNLQRLREGMTVKTVPAALASAFTATSGTTP